ncbi:MAG TPA: metallophosphoesterase [Bacteroidales bacterium]|nr:metallophosphoesterase [Bacteroidales bacterium]
MSLFLILITTEILTFAVLRQHFYDTSLTRFYISSILNFALSIWLWMLFFEISLYQGLFDTPGHIWLLMNFTGVVCAIVFPRIMLIFFHFTGKLIKRKTGNHIRSLTRTGMIISLSVFIIIATGTVFGRFNFRTEEVQIKIRGLNQDLDKLRIVQLSDLHLASFHHHRHLLNKVMERVNSYDPDLIINSGDFVSYGWREFDGFDTILKIARSRLGNYAVLGNHDFGTYHPFFTEADRNNNVLLMNQFITSSGYRVLNDDFTMIRKGSAIIALSGVTTMGRFPEITYGNLRKAVAVPDSSDLKILILHDPNQWEYEVKGKTDIDLTLAGHTHGMQMGILTKRFKWSPSQYFYPRWSGLYSEKDQFLVVNRGLGVLSIPFRIWMPPEITVIVLEAVQE